MRAGSPASARPEITHTSGGLAACLGELAASAARPPETRAQGRRRAPRQRQRQRQQQRRRRGQLRTSQTGWRRL